MTHLAHIKWTSTLTYSSWRNRCYFSISWRNNENNANLPRECKLEQGCRKLGQDRSQPAWWCRFGRSASSEVSYRDAAHVASDKMWCLAVFDMYSSATRTKTDMKASCTLSGKPKMHCTAQGTSWGQSKQSRKAKALASTLWRQICFETEERGEDQICCKNKMLVDN